ncbi:tyrosine-type recombinase/integrase [Paenibacillus rigui]|uniref:Site-specific integrase n=1 Tax=Paenibacillus rigui TaxID=554312 RepID=A0A229URK3_9BACL|nr:tyrosine-type recombinase/integrase [Paenibacillus rigui]OXM85815.1 site-specific integrase [Paenibacillus rigui]
MPSIEKRGTNSFRLIIESGYDSMGKRLKKSKTIRIDDEKLLKTTRKLQDYLDLELAKFKMEVEAGEYIAPDKMLFSNFVEEWKTKFVEKHLEGKTIDNYLLHVRKRINPHFGHLRMDKIKTLHIIDYLDKLAGAGNRMDGRDGALGSATIVYNYRVLRSIFSKAEEWKVIKENPMNGVKKPKEALSSELNVYSEAEVKELFEALQNENIRLRTLIALALTTGMRRGELIGLEWKHIDFENGIIEVKQSIPMYINGKPLIKAPKTASSVRKIALPHSIVEELKELQQHMRKERLKINDRWQGGEHNFVFCSWDGKPLAQNRPTKWWRELFDRHPQLKYIRFHDLRHTSATLLINQGVHAKIISNRLGHSKISTTMDTYGHVIQSADVAAAQKLDTLFQKTKKNA